MSITKVEGKVICIEDPVFGEIGLAGYTKGELYKFYCTKYELKIKGCPSELIVKYFIFPNDKFPFSEECSELIFKRYFKEVYICL